MKENIQLGDQGYLTRSRLCYAPQFTTQFLFFCKACLIYHPFQFPLDLLPKLEHLCIHTSITQFPCTILQTSSLVSNLQNSKNAISTLTPKFSSHQEEHSNMKHILSFNDLPSLLRCQLNSDSKLDFCISKAERCIQSLNRLSSYVKRYSEIMQPLNISSENKRNLLKRDYLECKRFMYSAIRNRKILIEYDACLNSCTKYDLSSSVQTNFDNTAVCILPDGTLLMSGGGYSHLNAETYRIDISQSHPSSTRLGDLNYPRGCIRLICYKDTVFAFGGWNRNDSKRAECMNWQSCSAWITLPDMIEPRYDLGHFISNDRIYILGGSRNTSIEYYDILRNRFVSVPSVKVPYGGIISAVDNDRIYIVDNYHLKVLDKNLKIVECHNYLDFEFYFGFNNFICSSNCIVRDGKLYYIRSDVLKAYECDLKKRQRSVLRSF